MLASELFQLLDEKVPPELALENDRIGYFGDDNPDKLEINKVQVLLDLLPCHDPSKLNADLVICHHPPLFKPRFPVYVIHSNWDIVKGGANDALAEHLGLNIMDVFDEKTGIGRICSTSTRMADFIKKLTVSLETNHIKLVNNNPPEVIRKLALVSGFGLNKPDYVGLAHKKKMDLFLSGDLTHQSALLAKNLGVNVVDATHYATEIPGLIKLCKLVSEFGLETDLVTDRVPWNTIKL
jgi:dinuclear metal center YbgI/SA1388 family protein